MSERAVHTNCALCELGFAPFLAYGRKYHQVNGIDPISCPLGAPTEPGSFVGDIWFGHPLKRTLGTHRWTGSEWEELPSEQDALLDLLTTERERMASLRAENERLRAGLGRIAGMTVEGEWSLAHHMANVARALLTPSPEPNDA